MMPEFGDVVKVHTKEQVYEGILLPRPEIFDDDCTILKLDNGYNIGIENKRIEKIEVVEKHQKKKEERHKIEHKEGLPNISILHTGGTIASKVDYRSGGVVAAFSPEDIVSMFPELAEIANIDSELIANMWSDDLRFPHFKLIAKVIEKKLKEGVDGIIIGMGTDNLAVASAALTFIVEQTPVPIILVGAQRSSDRGSSDAGMNLICAAEFIAKTDFAGVAICMHEHSDDKTCAVLPPTKTKKLHSSRRDAFKPVNAKPFARIFPDRIEVLSDYNTRKNGKKVKTDAKFSDKVALVKVYPGQKPEILDFYLKQKYKGIVLEASGLGHVPTQRSRNSWIKKLKEVQKKGVTICITSQTIYGRVDPFVYSNGRELLKTGIIGIKVAIMPPDLDFKRR